MHDIPKQKFPLSGKIQKEYVKGKDKGKSVLEFGEPFVLVPLFSWGLNVPENPHKRIGNVENIKCMCAKLSKII